jgi:endonuclease/exonuclease/phosphatase family metal-dependent hydrolase
MIVRCLLTLLLVLPAAAQSLRVMTYNVRYPNPNDGPDVWEKRRDLFVQSIRESKPDVFGTQELFQLQGEYVVQALPEYAWFGMSRRGNHEDEHMGIFYRRDRLKLIEQGQFWLSETPDVPGSQSWNMSLPRMVTWGLFQDGKRRFYLLNTHFAHRGEDEAARIKSAELIASRLRSITKAVPAILTGDFNAIAGGDVYKVLLKAGLVDTRPASAKGPEGTFHGFKGQPTNRIDWILATPGWKTRSYETITMNRDGRYPSDHFPVLVELDYP